MAKASKETLVIRPAQEAITQDFARELKAPQTHSKAPRKGELG